MRDVGDLAPGSRVLVVCSHDEIQARATVIRLMPVACQCGGAVYRLRINDGPAIPEGFIGDFCSDAIRRPN
jgi:hypothetical protein